MAVTEGMRALLLDIFEMTERLDKITVRLDPVSRTLTVVYEDLDDGWFREATAEPTP